MMAGRPGTVPRFWVLTLCQEREPLSASLRPPSNLSAHRRAAVLGSLAALPVSENTGSRKLRCRGSSNHLAS